MFRSQLLTFIRIFLRAGLNHVVATSSTFVGLHHGDNQAMFISIKRHVFFCVWYQVHTRI